MLTTRMDGGAQRAALELHGTIEAGDLARFSDALDEAVRDGDGGVVMIDVSGLEGWSLLAQAVVLATARRVAARGGELVLCNPSPTLRVESARLDTFGRVTTRDDRPAWIA